jgi:hypothetical protein
MNNIIWLQPNNTLAVTSIWNDDSAEEHAQLLLNRGDVPSDWQILGYNIELFPTWNRQEDWVWENSNIVVDFDRAKESTKERLRLERSGLLAALDVEFQRALEQNQSTSNIVAEKQRLRDITNLVDQCLSLDELLNLKVE